MRFNLQTVCTRSLNICRTNYTLPFSKLQTGATGATGETSGSKKLFIRGNISPDLFMQQPSAFILQHKRGPSNVYATARYIENNWNAPHVFFELLI